MVPLNELRDILVDLVRLGDQEFVQGHQLRQQLVERDDEHVLLAAAVNLEGPLLVLVLGEPADDQYARDRPSLDVRLLLLFLLGCDALDEPKLLAD